MTTNLRSALVVGGGVIGLVSAFTLASDGWRVTLFDPSPGRGATWAAAGMVAPSAEIAPGEQENFELQRGALGAWRALSAHVARVIGEPIALAETGTLVVGFDTSDRRVMDRFVHVATSYGVTPLRVTRETHASLFEGISPRVRDGLYLESDAWLDPDQVVAHLTRANEALGVTVVEEKVNNATTKGSHVRVTTDADSFDGDVGILATGASPLPRGVAERARNAVRPVRGMTVRVQGPDRSTLPSVRAYVRGRSFYMVSRPGGYCVLGASSDENADLLIEVGELQRLLRDALDVIPSLEVASLLETRQGLRPASSDLAPFFEVIDGRWAWSSGHYRHGVTLAPLAALDALAFAKGFS